MDSNSSTEVAERARRVDARLHVLTKAVRAFVDVFGYSAKEILGRPGVRDGAAALDYLFATGAYAGRDVTQLPREEEDVLRSYSLGANAYVREPVEFSESAAAAKTLGLFWLLLNEPAPTSRKPT